MGAYSRNLRIIIASLIVIVIILQSPTCNFKYYNFFIYLY